MLDWIVEQLKPKPLVGPAREYGNLSIGLSCAIALILIFQGAELLAFLLPITAAGMVGYRTPLFAILHTLVAVYLLDYVSDETWTPEEYGASAILSAWIVLPILVQLICMLRCMALASGDWNPKGNAKVIRRDQATFRGDEIVFCILISSAVFIVAAFILIWLETGVPYALFFALLPEGMRVVQLGAALLVVTVAMISFVTYIKNRSMDRFEANLVLQNVVWRWFGKEQAMIAKAHRRKLNRAERSTGIASKGENR